MKSWIALMALVTTIGLAGCSQSPAAASPSGEQSDRVQEPVSDSVSAAPQVEQEELPEAEAEVAGQPVGGAAATAGGAAEVTEESLVAEEAALAAEAASESVQNINESNYLRALADLERTIGADGA